LAEAGGRNLEGVSQPGDSKHLILPSGYHCT
jgi:hypothetical protein